MRSKAELQNVSAQKTNKSSAHTLAGLFLCLVTFCLADSGAPYAAGNDPGGTTAPAAAESSGAAPHPDVPKLPDDDAVATPSPPADEPAGYRMEEFRAPVPLTLKGARALTNDEAADIWNKSGAVFIDVYPQAPKPPNLPAGTFWRDPVHRSIEGARWLPNVGYGALSTEMADHFKSALETLSKGKRDTPLVFFCLKNCWMSWNAAKRALEYGYVNVMWFRDGTDGWQELGYPLVEVKKLP
jgi:PQQ-dependent catabolism-associated CXXCW motif protein